MANSECLLRHFLYLLPSLSLLPWKLGHLSSQGQSFTPSCNCQRPGFRTELPTTTGLLNLHEKNSASKVPLDSGNAILPHTCTAFPDLSHPWNQTLMSGLEVKTCKHPHNCGVLSPVLVTWRNLLSPKTLQ